MREGRSLRSRPGTSFSRFGGLERRFCFRWKASSVCGGIGPDPDRVNPKIPARSRRAGFTCSEEMKTPGLQEMKPPHARFPFHAVTPFFPLTSLNEGAAEDGGVDGVQGRGRGDASVCLRTEDALFSGVLIPSPRFPDVTPDRSVRNAGNVSSVLRQTGGGRLLADLLTPSG